MFQLLQSDCLWKEIERVRGRGPAVAAVAYANKDHMRLRAKDILICDASDNRIASGATSYALLSELAARKVQLWHLDKLHAKVIRTAGHVIVGSANMTTNAEHSIEAAILSDDPAAVCQVDAMLKGLLADKRLRPIDASFLRRIESIPVDLGGGGFGGQRRKERTSTQRQALAWLMGCEPLNERAVEQSNLKLSAVMGMEERKLPRYFRTTSKSVERFGRINQGDSLYFVDRLAKRVQRPVVVTGVIQVDGHLYYFHEDNDDRGISWTQVQKKLKGGLFERWLVTGSRHEPDGGHS